MERKDAPSREALSRAGKAIEAVSEKKAANDAMRKAAHDLSACAETLLVSRLDVDERRLGSIITSIRAVDDRIGLFFRYRYVERRSLKKVCQYFTIGTSTGSRMRERLIEIVAGRPDIMRALEVWAADKVPAAQAGRHKPTGM